MAKELDFDRSIVQENLAAARRRLERNQTALATGLTGGPAQRRAYGVFEDALMAAGLVRALGEPETQVQTFLVTAAQAAVEVFRWRGTLTGQVTYVPSMEEETFVDTSATNPDTFVRAVYAALAANLPEVQDRLASLVPEDYHSDQVTVLPVVEQYTRALHQVLAGHPEMAHSELRETLARSKGSRAKDDLYWLAQVKALDSLLGKDSAAFQAALAELSEVLKSYYAGPKYRNDPERFLALPVLGLAALAKKLGLPGSERVGML